MVNFFEEHLKNLRTPPPPPKIKKIENELLFISQILNLREGATTMLTSNNYQINFRPQSLS